MLDGIQPVESLGIELKENHLDRVVLRVPMQGNLNDKMTMFAGSQYSGLVLAGWRLASNWAADMGENLPVVIKSSNIDFYKPVTEALECVASLERKPKQGNSGNWKLKVRVEAKDSKGDVLAVLIGNYRVLGRGKRD